MQGRNLTIAAAMAAHMGFLFCFSRAMIVARRLLRVSSFLFASVSCIVRDSSQGQLIPPGCDEHGELEPDEEDDGLGEEGDGAGVVEAEVIAVGVPDGDAHEGNAGGGGKAKDVYEVGCDVGEGGGTEDDGEADRWNG